MKTAQLAALCFTCLLGFMPVSGFAAPYTTGDGIEITDLRTGLIWRSCAEGMVWDGTTCTGTASTFTHEAALQHAAAQASSTGVAWRLPNVKELSSIADKSLPAPTIDSNVFPATPSLPFWSATPYPSIPVSAWYVDFSSGAVMKNQPRATTPYNVRLVRTAP